MTQELLARARRAWAAFWAAVTDEEKDEAFGELEAVLGPTGVDADDEGTEP